MGGGKHGGSERAKRSEAGRTQQLNVNNIQCRVPPVAYHAGSPFSFSQLYNATATAAQLQKSEAGVIIATLEAETPNAKQLTGK
jgi:hypothetical protein